MKMGKTHTYKGVFIKNVPYLSKSRWFILDKDGNQARHKDKMYIDPFNTLKDAKEFIDTLVDIKE